MECRIQKIDDELQVVYGEVYPPNVPDTTGDFMTPVEVRKMAHRFMQKAVLVRSDTNHDNRDNGSHVVESFIVDWPSELYIQGAWVIGMHMPDRGSECQAH